MKLRSLALAALLFAGLPLASSSAFIGISVGFAPPPLPVYAQPPCPVEGYLWTPGYWGYGDVGYYWVPGVWVAPPRVGVYWTPGYWGYSGGSYLFNEGYWGPSVGFYGGINYGCGYGGRGYYGGEWAGGAFRYNTAVTRVNTSIIHNTYVNKTVINNYGGKRRASFNGPGGINRQPTPQERAATTAEHVGATPEQGKVAQAAARNPDFHAANNHGHPKVAAIKTPDEIGNQTGADKPGQKGQNAQNGGNDGQGAAAANAADKPGRKGANARNAADGAQGPAAADAGRGARNNANRKAAAQANDVATPHQPNAAKARQHSARPMPAQSREPRMSQAAQTHNRAANAIGNRGPQHRAQPMMQRSARPARMQAAPGPRGAGGPARAAAPDRRKRPNAKAAVPQ